MIVYGDHHIRIALHEFVAGFKQRLSRPTGASLDETRVRLILAGQLEQAAADADLPCAPQCRALTALAAEAFVRQALHQVLPDELRRRMARLHPLKSKLARSRFEERGLPLIGDDITSQVGAPIVHRVLAHLFCGRGIRLDRTYQLNFGGNADFRNILDRERLESKKISKTQSVMSQLKVPLPPTTSMSARATMCRGSRTASGLM